MLDPAFLDGKTWGMPGEAVSHVETHAAHIFLCGRKAFKMKKPVRLPYLDFSTREKRLAVLNHELAVNRPGAPMIYDRVIEVMGEPVLEMQRFPAEALLSAQTGKDVIKRDLARKLAEMVARSHAAAPQAAISGAEAMAKLGRQIAAAYRAHPDIFGASTASRFEQAYYVMRERLNAMLEARSSAGLVRRCHGDLHCGNIIVLEGEPVLFDAIEFNEEIATTDLLYDLAFLLMDLIRRGEPETANIVFNHYLHLRRKDEDLSGLAALPMFLAVRAGVRALVAADLAAGLSGLPAEAAIEKARSHRDECLAFLAPAQPRLVCIGGFSGTGKSTLAAALAPFISPPPGALHVRSDVERKAMLGMAETERLPPHSYTAEASRHVYEAIMRRAGAALAAGHSVVLDAVFAHESERAMAEAIAAQYLTPFTGLWLEAPMHSLKTRVESRRGDASDATAAVVERQLATGSGDLAWGRIDTSGPPGDVLALARQAL